MPQKPIKLQDGQFGIALFDDKGNYLSASHAFSGVYYKSEENAQRAIDRLNKKMGW